MNRLLDWWYWRRRARMTPTQRKERIIRNLQGGIRGGRWRW